MAEVFRTGVVGVGYVGLATAACLSHLGHSVLCVDKDEERIRVLEEGRVPFYEPGLEELVSRGVRGGRLSYAGPDGLPRLVGETDVVFITVDTPQGEDGSADLSNVGAVARSKGRALAEVGPPEGARSSWSTRARCPWGAGTTSRR